ncbi:Glutathione S-transferase U9 [Linum perenne]
MQFPLLLQVIVTWTSSYRARVELALQSIPFHFIEEDLYNKSFLLMNSNPIHEKNSSLIHIRKPIPETLGHSSYIGETLTRMIHRFFLI